MTLPAVDSQSLTAWLTDHALPLLIAAVVLFVVYRWARPAIHRVLVRVMHAQQAELSGDAALAEETDRRVATLEDLFAKILRFAVFVALIFVVLGVFDLWSVLAGLGLVLAALTLAGQSIILDYLMGILILTEGQFFKGDVVQLGTVEGTVEEVGLRRTVVRDVRGTVHSVSNGTIRVSSNRTRTYALATVDLDGIADRDVEGVIEVFDAVGIALSEDEAFAGKLQDVPGYAGTIRLSSAGATLRLSGRTQPAARAEVEAEMRRRVAAGLAARGIEPIRPGAYAPVDTR
jgi:small-conductance mechanosensitive channel